MTRLACSPITLDTIRTHSGFLQLAALSDASMRHSLTGSGISILLKSLYAFNRGVYSGIPILVSRFARAYRDHGYEEFATIASMLSKASFEEYGGYEGTFHLRLFFRLAEHFGIDRAELHSMKGLPASTVSFGEMIERAYEIAPLEFALGLHAASETTSADEFRTLKWLFIEGPSAPLTEMDSVSDYILVHQGVEDEHSKESIECIRLALRRRPEEDREVRRGIDSFLTGYGRMIAGFTRNLTAPPESSPRNATVFSGARNQIPQYPIKDLAKPLRPND